MKKFFLSLLLLILTALSVLVLRYWNNWNQPTSVNVISIELNHESPKIGEAIIAKVLIEAPLFYDLELNTNFDLPEGLNHLDHSTSKKRILQNDTRWLFTERFFANEQKDFQAIKRELYFHGIEDKKKLSISFEYPPIQVSSRDLTVAEQVKTMGEVKFPEPDPGLDIKTSILYVIVPSSVICLFFFTFLPRRKVVISKEQLAMIELQKLSAQLTPREHVIRIQDILRDYLSLRFSLEFASADLPQLKELISLTPFEESQILPPFELAHKIRFTGDENIDFDKVLFVKQLITTLKQYDKEQS